MRHCFALDLRDDDALIARYEASHRRIWPEVATHLRRQGVVGMEIYRLGTRMVMVMETDDAIYDPEAMARAVDADARLREWEALMWAYQAPTPWTPAGQKWTPMLRIFNLDDQPEG